MNSTGFSVADILSAQKRINGTVHYTPVLTSESLNNLCDGRKIFFKSEHMQKTGSFKARGALNAVKIVVEEGKYSSVITHSSGNFGQALAWAARQNGLKCTVVTPRDAPAPKVAAMRSYGAEMVLCEAKDRQAICEKLRSDDCEMIDPYNDHRVMAGQGTLAVEFLEQVPDLDVILVPVGGGGLCSGIAVAAKMLKPSIDVYCVEPIGKDLQRSLEAGQRLWSTESSYLLETVADGIRVLRVGDKCFKPIFDNCMKNVLTVSDKETVDAMKLIYSRLKQAVEPTAAISLAAFIKYHEQFLKKYSNVGLVLCGGNVDLSSLPFTNDS